MPSGTGATKSGCKVTTYFSNCQTFSRFFALGTVNSIKKNEKRELNTVPFSI